MRILWLDPYHGGSHAAVAEGYARASRHSVIVRSLNTAGGWRWRMRGAALSFMRMIEQDPDLTRTDLLVTTDMLDLATWLGLTRRSMPDRPVALYMHENQLTYPLPAGRKLEIGLPWINYTAALAADRLFFNSAFHRDSFLAALPALPGRFHDFREMDLIDTLRPKAHVLYPGLDLRAFDHDPPHGAPPPGAPVILWNSRWEYDKGPEAFFDALRALAERGIAFRLIIAGQHIDPDEPAFAEARAWAAPYCLWWGYAPDAAAYRTLLRQADIVVSTAAQEFFGIAVLEALYAGCVPVLPRRLSYPELIPPELHDECFYDDQDGLVERLARTIDACAAGRRRDWRPVAAQFSWAYRASAFDAAFEALRS